MIHFLKFQILQFLFYKDVVKSSLLSIFTIFIAIGIMQKNHEISNFLPFLLVILPITTATCHIDKIFYDDYKSGNLEFLLIAYDTGTIIFVKALGLFFSILFVIICSIIFSSLFFDIGLSLAIRIISSSIFVTNILTMIIMVIGAIRIYFEKNNGMLSAIIFPFLIPILILHGLYIDSHDNTYLSIAIGICMVVTPILWCLCRSLISEFYNN